MVLAGMVTGDTKAVTPYSFPGVVVVGEAPTKAVSYVHHTAAAAVPTFRSAAVHCAVPQAVHAVQYAAPYAVRYAAAPAVGYSPMVYSATYHQPDVARPLTYAATVIKDVSLEDDIDDLKVSPYGMFDDDHFDFDDHDDRK